MCGKIFNLLCWEILIGHGYSVTTNQTVGCNTAGSMVLHGLISLISGAPVITSLAFSRLTQTLTCLSYGGPTTFTFWTRNGEVIPSNSPNYYDRSQSITDTEQGSYRNILHVLSPVLYEGNFTCTVSNSEGNSSIESEERIVVVVVVFSRIKAVALGNTVKHFFSCSFSA